MCYTYYLIKRKEKNTMIYNLTIMISKYRMRSIMISRWRMRSECSKCIVWFCYRILWSDKMYTFKSMIKMFCELNALKKINKIESIILFVVYS